MPEAILPSATSLTKEIAVPALKRHPYVDIHAVALAWMRVGDGYITEVERLFLVGEKREVHHGEVIVSSSR